MDLLKDTELDIYLKNKQYDLALDNVTEVLRQIRIQLNLIETHKSDTDATLSNVSIILNDLIFRLRHKHKIHRPIEERNFMLK